MKRLPGSVMHGMCTLEFGEVDIGECFVTTFGGINGDKTTDDNPYHPVYIKRSETIALCIPTSEEVEFKPHSAEWDTQDHLLVIPIQIFPNTNPLPVRSR